MKRPIAKYFSISHVLDLEPHMNTIIEDLIKHLDKQADPQKPCDLGSWIGFCTLPAISPFCALLT